MRSIIKCIALSFVLIVRALDLSAGLIENINFNSITINDGLTNNHITSFCKSSTGHMWIGTESGLNRFNGYGIKQFTRANDGNKFLHNNSIIELCEDSYGLLWVRTKEGYSVFDPHKEAFVGEIDQIFKSREIKGVFAHNLLYICANDLIVCYSTDNSGVVVEFTNSPRRITIPLSIINNSAMVAGHLDQLNRLWIINRNCEVFLYDCKSATMINKFTQIKRENYYPDKVVSYVDKGNNLWIVDKYDKTDLYLLDWKTNTVSRQKRRFGIPDRVVLASLTGDNSGNIWVGTDHDGIYLYNTESNSCRNIRANAKNQFSLLQNSVVALFCDDKDIIWAGTYKHGVNYYHKLIFNAVTYRIDESHKEYNDINSIVEDSNGDLLLGTNGRGLFRCNLKSRTFTPIPLAQGNEIIVRMLIDNRKNLWVGTYRDGLYKIENGRVRSLKNDPSDRAIPAANIWALAQDNKESLWVGTLSNGIYHIDNKGSVGVLHNNKGANSCIKVFSVNNDKIIVGTLNGLAIYSPQQILLREIALKDKNDNTPCVVVDIQQTKDGHIWIATDNGLVLCNSDISDYVYLKGNSETLAGNINNIIVDRNDNIWFTSKGRVNYINTQGLKDIHRWTPNVVTFSLGSGMLNREYNDNCGILTSDNKIILGGVDGINILDLELLAQNKEIPVIEFTQLFVNNNPVAVGEEKNRRKLLTQSLSDTRIIELNHNENTFTLEFQPISFFNNKHYNYQYQLEGYSNQWVNAEENNYRAVFTNINSGLYTLNIRIRIGDQVISESACSIKIRIKPPLWLQWWAIMSYLIIMLALVVFTTRNISRFRKLRNEISEKEAEKKRIEEMNAIKLRFFTNLSHELRTPLTLISSPIEEMRKRGVESFSRMQIDLIARNAKRLLFIVNQLLDFRKIEISEISLHNTSNDIVAFTVETVNSFMDIAEKKHIHLVVKTEVEQLVMDFDTQKYERILFNILSNAFKFTDNHGEVVVRMGIDPPAQNFVLKISDTGIGIEKDKLPSIFKRFFQVDTPHSIINQGSGIGLSITHEFVTMHNGTIEVESQQGEGTSFIIKLPINSRAKAQEVIAEKQIYEINNHPAVSHDDNMCEVDGKLKVLVVEDNEDMRFYVKENLKEHYIVYHAKDGKDGLEKALDKIPDIIVSDVMMPVMDGLELCLSVKNDARISHIPIILLTARTTETQQLEGFEVGADDYLPKPFNINILKHRINNLLKRRLDNHKKINTKKVIELASQDITPLDEKILRKVIAYIENNISSIDLTVEMLSREIGMSSVYLNKKLNALVGKSSSELIRSIRLKYAAELLEKGGLMVAEVAYEVGFNNPKYFSRHFKDEFGVLPTEYQKRHL